MSRPTYRELLLYSIFLVRESEITCCNVVLWTPLPPTACHHFAYMVGSLHYSLITLWPYGALRVQRAHPGYVLIQLMVIIVCPNNRNSLTSAP